MPTTDGCPGLQVSSIDVGILSIGELCSDVMDGVATNGDGVLPEDCLLFGTVFSTDSAASVLQEVCLLLGTTLSIDSAVTLPVGTE